MAIATFITTLYYGKFLHKTILLPNSFQVGFISKEPYKKQLATKISTKISQLGYGAMDI